MSAGHYDAIIIGSGQSGTPLASAFAAAGRKTAIIDRRHIGGTCVNEGCTPTKTMIASGRAAYVSHRGDVYGVRTSRDATVDLEKVRQRKRDIVDSWSKGGETRLIKAGVDVIKGEARFIGPKEIEVRMVEGGKTRLTAETVFINTGERPAKPKIPGLENVAAQRILDSTSVMELGEVPSHLIVVGGGYIGLEFSQLFRRLGAQVTIVQRAKQLVPREDEDVAKAMLEILQEDGIAVHLSSTIESVSRADSGLNITITTDLRGTIKKTGSHLLLAAGRVPNTDMLNLSTAGVELTSSGHIIVDDLLRTNIPGVYALGDVHGGPAFTHISYDDFRVIRANLIPTSVPSTAPKITSTKASPSRNFVPYVVYTDPQLGHIGLHAKDTINRKTRTATMPMSFVARAIEMEETRGLMKATVDAETGEILGFTCLGIEGGEIMAVVQAAMLGGLKWWDLEATVWAHPSLAESLNNLWGYLE
ncbi:FAD-dependent pyridine nucleotide-disulfide oxidoreductase [Colletotrichum truncatum]|uniref:FAD-dependent pyridine nucleotide-disulfide oxidoreductase n=1 Tax=Colletotrichum truncatum TaxID=5467 RepID=A0ACC3YII5_COLTU|nr:FAD-dependent pyridine nucleotide-disulfide oxidoreductase [Colletotrichum truncatum]KAF6794465.1 FAD-dependent pyridine nucleotide-disulfide oxidoreductase [Colletotrichum truncatum]